MILASDDTESNFSWLVNIMREHKDSTPKMLIFFNRAATLNAVYLYVTHHISQQPGDSQPLIAMFSKTTSDSCKEHVMTSMAIESALRVVLCTSSLSVGVNFTNIKYVIHYGIPSTPSDFLQETGRAAREPSSTALSVVIGYPRMVRKETDSAMRSYVKTDNRCCRRALLLKPFNIVPTNVKYCCDICQPELHLDDIVIQAVRSQFGCDEELSSASSANSQESIVECLADLSVLDI